MDHLGKILEEAARHDWLIDRADGRTLEVSKSTFTRAVRKLGMVPWHRGIWVYGAGAVDHRTEIEAAARAVGAPALLTGGSVLWVDRVVSKPPACVCLAVPLHRSTTDRPGVCIHHSSRYDEVRYRNVGQLQLAQTVHALADYARHTDVTGMIRAIADADRLRLCTLDRCRNELDRRQRFPGRTVFRTAIGQLSGELTHSGAERLGRRLLRQAGLVFGPRPLVIEAGGRPVAEVDIPFPELRYGVEVDGPPHLLVDVAAADRARDRQLGRIGWAIDRFMWLDLERDPRGFVREVTAAVEQRRRELD